jgi:serine/threonine-protein kinase
LSRKIGSRYTAHQVLGRGSAGTVWLGEGPEGPVAIKLLREDLASDQELVGRFVQERTALLSLDHPRVVGVRDLVVDGNDLALVMDLIRGTDLRTRLDRERRLSPEAAVAIAADVADGLAAAHAAQIVHRDVKPENVLLDMQGPLGPGRSHPALLTDFGIARLVDEPGRARGGRPSRGQQPSQGRSPNPRSVIGTPDYLAPEIIEGLPPRASVDVYALATVLYELLAGFTPFGGGHPGAILRRHVTETVAPLPGIPDELWQLLLQCLAKAPASRLRASELAERLREILPGLAGYPPLDIDEPDEPDEHERREGEGAHQGRGHQPAPAGPGQGYGQGGPRQRSTRWRSAPCCPASTTREAVVTIRAGPAASTPPTSPRCCMRMYLRWAERHGYPTEVYDTSYAEEAGIKSPPSRSRRRTRTARSPSSRAPTGWCGSPVRQPGPPADQLRRGRGAAGGRADRPHRDPENELRSTSTARRAPGAGRQHHRLRRAAHPHPDRHRGLLPERASQMQNKASAMGSSRPSCSSASARRSRPRWTRSRATAAIPGATRCARTCCTRTRWSRTCAPSTSRATRRYPRGRGVRRRDRRVHRGRHPLAQPTDEPTGQPTDEPTDQPTGQPTGEPTDEPSGQPSSSPSQGGGAGGDDNTCTVDLDSTNCDDNTDTDSVGSKPVEQGKAKEELAETGASSETTFLLIGAATMIAGGIGFRVVPRLANRNNNVA